MRGFPRHLEPCCGVWIWCLGVFLGFLISRGMCNTGFATSGGVGRFGWFAADLSFGAFVLRTWWWFAFAGWWF